MNEVKETGVELDFAVAQDIAARDNLVDANDYEVAPEKVEVKETGPESKNPGRHYLNWTISIQNNEDSKQNGRKLFLITMLPYIDNNGDLITTGCGTLASFCNALGLPWQGAPEDYILANQDQYLSSACIVRVTIKEPTQKDIDKGYDSPKNRISKFWKL